MLFHKKINNAIQNFLRKDLNLSKYWWHRLFLVIFWIIVLLLAVWFFVLARDIWVDKYLWRAWYVTSSVNERLSLINGFVQLRDLKQSEEMLGERSNSNNCLVSYNYLYDDLYCSNNLIDNLESIQEKSGITHLYIREKFGLNNVPVDLFVKYIKKNKIRCLAPDAYFKFIDHKNVRIRFLAPVGPNSYYAYLNNLVFCKESSFLRVVYIMKLFFVFLMIILFVAFVYYKVIIYIIFGYNDAVKNE